MQTVTLPRILAPRVALTALAPACQVLATGARASRLASFVTAQSVARRRVRIVCADNRFDPFLIARLAKTQGISAVDALSAVLIARAFTCYQLVELINRLEPKAGEVVLITGVCAPFLDEDVSHLEAARMFYKAFWRLKELARGGLSLLMTQSEEAASERRAYFLRDLCAAADAVLKVNGETTFVLEQRRRLIQNL